jgi:predicted transcriptional regulator
MGALKRDRLQVIFDILKTVADHNNSIRPTPLLRQSNLSTSGFSEYYKELIEKDFIKEMVDRKGARFVTLSDKGFRFLEKYPLIRGMIEEFEL